MKKQTLEEQVSRIQGMMRSLNEGDYDSRGNYMGGTPPEYDLPGADLVKKVIRENQQEMEVQQMANEFNQKVGEDLSPEEYKEVMCAEPGEFDMPNITDEQKQKVDELKEKMKGASFAQLMQVKKQLNELKRQSKQQTEQVAGPAVISLLGVSMPPAFAIAIGGIIFIMLLTFLSRFIHFRKRTTYFCDGTRSRGLFGLLRW